MSKIKKNWITIIMVVIISTVAYMNYKIELYTYFCEKESNAPACYVLHKELLEINEPSKAKRFLKVSCDLKYNLACKELGEYENSHR